MPRLGFVMDCAPFSFGLEFNPQSREVAIFCPVSHTNISENHHNERPDTQNTSNPPEFHYGCVRLLTNNDPDALRWGLYMESLLDWAYLELFVK